MEQKKIKILIVEDNPADTDLLRIELKKADFSFIWERVETETDYINSIHDFRPDIILSDYSLPAFDGISAFRIKQKISEDIPFIMVSGTVGEEKAVELIRNGVSDYALKDKLFTLPQKIMRALKEAEEKKERRANRIRLQQQHKKLYEIAVMQSHQVRGPVASVLGLINLINFKKPTDPANIEVILKLQTVAKSFDDLIKNIVEKTDEIKELQA